MRETEPEGADVAFTYLTGHDEAEQVAGLVRGLGRRALALRADLGDPAAAAMVVRQAVGSFLASEKAGFVTGQVIYNVGGQHGPIRRLAA